MASDTDTRKPRWLQIKRTGDRTASDLDRLMDLYWGGSERRISGLTVRIIGVNAAALLILVIGIIYLGQYQTGLIQAKLETFSAELELISTAVSVVGAQKGPGGMSLSENKVHNVLGQLNRTSSQRILVFDMHGNLLADSRKIADKTEAPSHAEENEKHNLHSVQMLKDMAGFIVRLMPFRNNLHPYPHGDFAQAQNVPDAYEALQGSISSSVWQDENGNILLSAAAPLNAGGQVIGSVLLMREARDIKRDIGDVWLNIVKVFLICLVITTFLSIYLSGTIARPLRKLAKAAEAVRSGKARINEIPDLSRRHDEIGELSLVLRDMTQALWERMDSIENFAADVAHELKNPLTSLKSAVETAMIVKTEADRKKMMDIISHDIHRLDRLITDISSASRLDAELSRQSFEIIDLRRVLRALVNIYCNPLERDSQSALGWSASARCNGVTIRLHCDSEDDVFVWGLQGRLAQVFENLLSNALSFSPDGSEINIRVHDKGKQVEIHIEDEGPGIPKNKLEAIFERFYSERPEHEGYGHHSGLGLSICRQIVKAMDGKIFAQNIKDENQTVRGARFTVILKTVQPKG